MISFPRALFRHFRATRDGFPGTNRCTRDSVVRTVTHRRHGGKELDIMRSAYLLVGALAAVTVAACSSSSDSGSNNNPETGGETGGTPSIKITKPANNTTMAITDLTDGTDLDVSYTVTNFDLKAPGTCGTEKACGHIHVYVNGDACNATGLPANAEDITNPITAGIDYCKTGVVAGNYVVKLELHDDTHALVKDSTGNGISDQINVMLTGGADAGGDSATDATGD
jgi:hypothetical protein